MTDSFPTEGRLLHVANEFQWNVIVEILDGLGVKPFEIPPGPSVPDSDAVATYGLMFKDADE